jgi:hypothetical protein
VTSVDSDNNPTTISLSTNMLRPPPLVLSMLTFLVLITSILHLATSSSSTNFTSFSPLNLFPTPSLHMFFYAWYGQSLCPHPHHWPSLKR